MAPAVGRARPGPSGAPAAAGPGAEGAGGPSRPASAVEVRVDWDAVVARARARGAQECPICLGAIARRGNEGGLQCRCWVVTSAG